MKFTNLTPHTINIKKSDGSVLEIAPSGVVTRCKVSRKLLREEDGVSLFYTEMGEVENLPDNGLRSPLREGDTMAEIFIVSAIVLASLSGTRPDVVSPGELIRNEAGQPIACNGLTFGG